MSKVESKSPLKIVMVRETLVYLQETRLISFQGCMTFGQEGKEGKSISMLFYT